MKAFIWISHGEPEVYLLETEEQREKVRKLLIEVLIQGGCKISEECTWRGVLEAIDNERYSDNDSFQYGTGIVNIKE